MIACFITGILYKDLICDCGLAAFLNQSLNGTKPGNLQLAGIFFSKNLIHVLRSCCLSVLILVLSKTIQDSWLVFCRIFLPLHSDGGFHLLKKDDLNIL